VYRPEQEEVLALRGYTFGLDVIVWIGQQRYSRHRCLPEIHRALIEAGVSISFKEVQLLGEVYLGLVSTVVGSDATRIEQMKEQGGIILALDGVQPEKGNETLYLLRDVLSGSVLVARNLASSATGEIQTLIDEVLATGVAIRGVVSDKQESICLAVEKSLPGVPHQLCQYHYLRDLAKPVFEADRRMKKEIKARVRGMRDVEKRAEKILKEEEEEKEGDGSRKKEAAIARDYCEAIREVIRQDGKEPLEPGGLKLVERNCAGQGIVGTSRGDERIEVVEKITDTIGRIGRLYQADRNHHASL
jgi:hypothetical protein